MKRHIFFFFGAVSLLLISSAHAEFGKGPAIQAQPRVRVRVVRAQLTAVDIERVKAFKQLSSDVDKKSLSQIIDEIQTADNPQLELAMQEAIAKTYCDVAKEQNVVEQKQKEWLYSMVTMNMAYLQFGAKQDDSGNALNRLVRRKLREYLPPEVLNQPGFQVNLQLNP